MTQPTILSTDDLRNLWRDVFRLSEPVLNVACESLDFWSDRKLAEREIFFFLAHIVTESHDAENTPRNQAWNAHPQTIKQSLYDLARSGGTLDPCFPTAYTSCRYDKRLGALAMRLDLNHKGKLFFGKAKGFIKDVCVHLVYSNDTFNWKGADCSPEHQFDPFATEEVRGGFVGGYVVTTRPDDSVEAMFLPHQEIDAILSMSDKALLAKWPDKMRLKTLINQASKDWEFYQSEEETNQKIVGSSLDTLDGVAPSSSQTDFCRNIYRYASTLIDDSSLARELYATMLSELDAKPALSQSPVFSKVAVYLALAKYNLSLSKRDQEAYLMTRSIGNLMVVEPGVMYKGLRRVAFSGTLKTTQDAPDKITYALVHENDKFTYHGDFERPDHIIDVMSPRGAMIGGFVVIHRGDKVRTCVVSRSLLSTIASCSSSSVKRTWPRQYFEIKLLKQSFNLWI